MKQTKRRKGLIILLFCIAIVAVTVSIVYFKSDIKELKLILKNIEGVKKSEFVYKGDTLK